MGHPEPDDGTRPNPVSHFLIPVKEYQAVTGRVYPGRGDDRLFSFGPGGPMRITTALQDNVGTNAFEVAMTLTEGSGHTGTVRGRGGLSAHGLLTSGTGNFDIAFGGGGEVTLGGRTVRVTFGDGYYSESGVYTKFSVEEVVPTETPEPGTLALAGVGLACGAGAWVRRRKCGSGAV